MFVFWAMYCIYKMYALNPDAKLQKNSVFLGKNIGFSA